jgi:hypothetical protein
MTFSPYSSGLQLGALFLFGFWAIAHFIRGMLAFFLPSPSVVVVEHERQVYRHAEVEGEDIIDAEVVEEK